MSSSASTASSGSDLMAERDSLPQEEAPLSTQASQPEEEEGREIEEDAEMTPMREEEEEEEPEDYPVDDLAPEEQAAEEDRMEVEGEVPERAASDEEDEEEEEETKAAEALVTAYSTRGRAAELSQERPLDRLAGLADAVGGAVNKEMANLHGPPAPTTMRESFLSDSLTEEERRTRTRYLPQVEGMHPLRKQEIKGDLSLARSIVYSSGASGTVKLTKRKQRDEDASSMGDVASEVAGGTDSEAEKAPSGSQGDEDLRSDIVVPSTITRTIEVGSTELVLPSTAFVAPPTKEKEESSKKATDKNPSEVEAVAAFNPPRPPESVGPKKKHRMLRWERRPEDIEVDLKNYRRTVQKTREELKKAEAECERIRIVDNLTCRHLLQHINGLNEELCLINDELATVQQECVDAADLLPSRTRTRGGAGKGLQYGIMRDVISVLRAKGAEMEAKGLLLLDTDTAEEPQQVEGVGGVSAASFADWDRSTAIRPINKLASTWITPGDKVESPYGEGVVLAFHPPGALDVKEAPHPALLSEKKQAEVEKTSDAMDVDPPSEDKQSSPATKKSSPASKKSGSPSATDSPSGQKKTKKGAKADKDKGKEERKDLVDLLPPRVSVKLPFGVGFFSMDALKSKEPPPSTYSDVRLARRWQGILESASGVGGFLDVAAMANFPSEEELSAGMAGSAMDVEREGGENHSTSGKKRRLIPFGAGMFPTAIGRGALLHKAGMDEVEKSLGKILFEGTGVLGRHENSGVPQSVREKEDLHQEHLILRAKVLQLQNQVYRQRRTRMLNEKTYAATQERASKVESLVAEMRTDLKSLKSRLDQEIRDLGISEEQAEGILTSFYESLDSQHAGEASPPKRPRRQSQMEFDVEEEELDLLTSAVSSAAED